MFDAKRAEIKTLFALDNARRDAAKAQNQHLSADQVATSEQSTDDGDTRRTHGGDAMLMWKDWSFEVIASFYSHTERQTSEIEQKLN